MTLRAWYGIWFGLASMLWYMVWPGGHCSVYGGLRTVYSTALQASHGIMLWPDGPGIGYDIALRASHGIVWPGGHRIVYGMAWRASHGIWSWPGRQGMRPCIVYGMAWRA